MKNLRKGMSFEEWTEQFNESWDKFTAECYTSVPSCECRLYACTAMVNVYQSCITLTSYRTMVAVYSMEDKTVLIKGRYSATTDQHVAKFLRWLCQRGYPVRYTVLDYCKSRNEVGYDFHDLMVIRCYKKDGICDVDRDGTRYARWNLPCYHWNA